LQRLKGGGRGSRARGHFHQVILRKLGEDSLRLVAQPPSPLSRLFPSGSRSHTHQRRRDSIKGHNRRDASERANERRAPALFPSIRPRRLAPAGLGGPPAKHRQVLSLHRSLPVSSRLFPTAKRRGKAGLSTRRRGVCAREEMSREKGERSLALRAPLCVPPSRNGALTGRTSESLREGGLLRTRARPPVRPSFPSSPAGMDASASPPFTHAPPPTDAAPCTRPPLFESPSRPREAKVERDSFLQRRQSREDRPNPPGGGARRPPPSRSSSSFPLT